MSSQVRAIHRAITGDDIPDHEPSTEEARPPDEEIARRFLELEALVRALPELAERVPQVWFRPPLDVIAGDAAILLELALPGVERQDVTVTCVGDELVIGGLRRDPHALVGRLFHAELPRGPFRRVVPLPFAVGEAPRWELERGVLRIHLNVPANVPTSLAEGHTQGERANDDDGSR